MRFIAIILIVLAVGFYKIPPEVIESVETLHASNILICEDYTELLPQHYQGDELVNKYNLVLKHLELSKQLVETVRKYK